MESLAEESEEGRTLAWLHPTCNSFFWRFLSQTFLAAVLGLEYGFGQVRQDNWRCRSVRFPEVYSADLFQPIISFFFVANSAICCNHSLLVLLPFAGTLNRSGHHDPPCSGESHLTRTGPICVSQCRQPRASELHSRASGALVRSSASLSARNRHQLTLRFPVVEHRFLSSGALLLRSYYPNFPFRFVYRAIDRFLGWPRTVFRWTFNRFTRCIIIATSGSFSFNCASRWRAEVKKTGSPHT